MEPRMILISTEQVERLIRMMSRAEGYCRKAQSTSLCDIHDDATASYPGASGYAGATLREAIQVLESAL